MRRGCLIVLCGAFLCGSMARAQFGRGLGDFVTSGYDPQRSAWIRNETKFSVANMEKPGFEFLWKLKLDANAKQSFAPPILLNNYIGYRGFRSLAYVGATGNKIVALDSDLGRIEWQQQLPGGASSTCGALMTSLTRSTTAAFPGAGGRGGGGRGNAATSAVSEPNQGSVIYQQMLARAANAPGGSPQPGRGRAFQPVPPGLPPRDFGVIYSLASDGMLHTVFLSSGRAAVPPTPFLPVNSNALGLVVLDDFAYAAVAPQCGNVAETIMAVDLSSKQVFIWKPESGQIAGSAGPAIGPDGTLYVATTGGELAVLEAKTLNLKTAYKAGQPFASSPVVFEFKDRVMIAAAAKDRRIHLLDTRDFDKAVATTDANLSLDALASWQDSAGTRWILGAGRDALVALKVVDQDGALALQSGWSSPAAAPVAPLVVNGVVFTASTGATPSVVYALDATTGKELWNSGKAITGAIRSGGISVGNAQVYLATADGTFYAFGFPIEH